MIHTGDCIKIGVIGKTHNLQGAVVVHADADLLERYLHEPVFILLEGAPVPFYIAPGGLTPRNHTSCIVKFDYVDTKARANRLVGRDLLVPRDSLDLDTASDDSPDLSDYTVLDARTGATGQLLRVDNYSGNIVFTIALLGKEILLPYSEDYVLDILPDRQLLRVHVPEDIFNLY